MENIVYQRINEILSNKRVSVNGLSKLVGMAQTTLNTQLRGERALSVFVVVKILEVYPDISAEWLLRGEGSMYKTDGTQQTETTLANSQEESIWKAKYEAIKDCYDTLVATLGGGLSKINQNVG